MRRCARSPTSSRNLTSGAGRRASLCRPLTFRGDEGLGHRRARSRGMEVVRNRGAGVVHDRSLVPSANEISWHVHPSAGHGNMAMYDELPRLARREGEAFHERQGLEAPGEHRLHIECEDVVEGCTVEREESEPAEAREELAPLFLRLWVRGSNQGLELPRPLAEPSEDGLGLPQFPLVLQAILLEEFVLRLDPFPLPWMRGPGEHAPGKFRVAQPFTPSSLSFGRPLPSPRPSLRRCH